MTYADSNNQALTNASVTIIGARDPRPADQPYIALTNNGTLDCPTCNGISTAILPDGRQIFFLAEVKPSPAYPVFLIKHERQPVLPLVTVLLLVYLAVRATSAGRRLRRIEMKVDEAVAALNSANQQLQAIGTEVDHVKDETTTLLQKIQDLQNAATGDLPQALTDAIQGVVDQGAVVAGKVKAVDDLVPDTVPAPAVATPAPVAPAAPMSPGEAAAAGQ